PKMRASDGMPVAAPLRQFTGAHGTFEGEFPHMVDLTDVWDDIFQSFGYEITGHRFLLWVSDEGLDGFLSFGFEVSRPALAPQRRHCASGDNASFQRFRGDLITQRVNPIFVAGFCLARAPGDHSVGHRFLLSDKLTAAFRRRGNAA